MSSNRVLIEHRGVSTIYFDRNVDKFYIEVNKATGTYRKTLAQARTLADSHGEPTLTPDIGLQVAVETTKYDINKKAGFNWLPATLIAFDKHDNVRVRYADGIEKTTWLGVCVLQTEDDVNVLNTLRDNLERAEKAYEAAKTLRKLPKTLEEAEAEATKQRLRFRRQAKKVVDGGS